MRDRLADPQRVTDDQRQLAWEKKRLAVAEAKQAAAPTAIDRWYYEKCAAGWRRSIAVLERRCSRTTSTME